jgi:hypothetical protein
MASSVIIVGLVAAGFVKIWLSLNAAEGIEVCVRNRYRPTTVGIIFHFSQFY